MARKTLGDTSNSKLANRTEATEEDRQRPAVIHTRKTTLIPKSFRLGGTDIERFQRLSSRLDQEAKRPVSDTAVLKGLLLLGERTDTKKLLSAIKDAAF